MANITNHTQLLTIQAIYRHYEQSRGGGHRPHLGASQIGHPCDRFLWYQFHWCDSKTPEGRVLRLFDHGDVEEERIVRDLRNIGVTVYDVDPDTGRQFLFTAFGGHFGCSLDGVGQGFWNQASGICWSSKLPAPNDSRSSRKTASLSGHLSIGLR